VRFSVAGRVHSALDAALLGNAVFRDRLLQQGGFTIYEVCACLFSKSKFDGRNCT
jgi:hypothetical protein